MAVGKKVLMWGIGLTGGFFVALVLALVVIRLFVGWFFVVPQNGMYPAIPAGSWVFGLKRPYVDVSQVARGDVIMFERVENGQRYIYIWRVIGLPGERVTIAGNKLTINDREMVREQLHSNGESTIYRESVENVVYDVAYRSTLPPDIPQSTDVTVPMDHVFVMGDNRHQAVDSRIFGPIPFSSITAKKW